MRDRPEIDDWFSPQGPKVPRFWMPILMIGAAIMALLLLWGACL